MIAKSTKYLGIEKSTKRRDNSESLFSDNVRHKSQQWVRKTCIDNETFTKISATFSNFLYLTYTT